MKASLATTPPIPLPGGAWKLQWPAPADQGQPSAQTPPMADAGNPIPPDQTYGVAPPAPGRRARGAPLVISPLAQGAAQPQRARRSVALWPRTACCARPARCPAATAADAVRPTRRRSAACWIASSAVKP